MIAFTVRGQGGHKWTDCGRATMSLWGHVLEPVSPMGAAAMKEQMPTPRPVEQVDPGSNSAGPSSNPIPPPLSEMLPPDYHQRIAEEFKKALRNGVETP